MTTESVGARWFDWWPALVVAMLATAAGMLRSWPVLPQALHLQITLPAGEPGQSEPLIVTGHSEDGDFLVVRYEPGQRVAFGYDSWGSGGPTSAPVRYEPGSTHELVVRMPALNETIGASAHRTAPLRVTFDGREILHADVPFHRRRGDELYFGVNATGGSTGARFSGTLRSDHGALLIGGPESLFPRSRRVVAFLLDPSRMLGVLLLGLVTGLFSSACRRAFRPPAATAPGDSRPPHLWFGITASIAVVAFVFVVTAFSFQLMYPDWFGYFYDFHAVGLLHGRLDVPDEGISGEAFVHGGKYYGYFGPTPALMRIPFALLGLGFAQLSRVFMTIDYALCLGAAYFLLGQATRICNRNRQWPSRWATVVLVGTVGLGSTLFFLGSRAYVYDEAILCGAAFALWAAYCVLRYLEFPDSRWWLGALACGTLSVNARPPAGFYALVLLGFAAAANLWRAATPASHLGARIANGWRLGRVHIFVGILAVLGVLSFNGLSYLKFGTIEGCPLRLNVQYDAKRLARIDGKEFHLSNVRYGVDAYILRPTLQLDRHFPFLSAHAPSWREYPAAKLDLTEPIAGLPYVMPALCLLSLVGLAGCLRRTGLSRIAVVVTWAAVIPPALAMFAAIAVSHRYTGDFVPFLATAAALGLALLDGNASPLARIIRWGVAITCVASVAITAALTLGTQAAAFGTPPAAQQRFQSWQHTVDSWFGVDEPH